MLLLHQNLVHLNHLHHQNNIIILREMWPSSELLRAWAESVEFLTRDTLINSIEPRLELIKGLESCSMMLVNTEFGNSYGKPVIGTFPNLDCKSYNQVVLKLKASVEGRQFDRTGAL